MKVKIKKLRADAMMPTKAHATDAGYDLYAVSRERDDHGNFVYHTGISIEIPKGYVGLLFPRSSVCKMSLSLSNSVGVIDSGYRGEITAKFKDYSSTKTLRSEIGGVIYIEDGARYDVGDRICQLIIMPYPEVEFIEVEELTDSDRGEGGYGSSGC